MTDQNLINTLAGIVLACFGWWVNNIWAMVKSQQSDITQLHIKLAENYVPRAELEARLTRMQDTLDEIRENTRRHA